MTLIPGSSINIALGDATNSVGLAQYGLVVPDTGAHDVVITMSASCNIFGGADSWTGINQSTPFGTAVTANAADTTTTIDIGSVAEEVAVGSALIVTATALASNDTERWNSGVLENVNSGGASQVGAASVTLDWTGAFGTPFNWLASAVSLKTMPFLIDPSILI